MPNSQSEYVLGCVNDMVYITILYYAFHTYNEVLFVITAEDCPLNVFQLNDMYWDGQKDQESHGPQSFIVIVKNV